MGNRKIENSNFSFYQSSKVSNPLKVTRDKNERNRSNKKLDWLMKTILLKCSWFGIAYGRRPENVDFLCCFSKESLQK